jgi:Family of unknown function (DUF6125)/L-2-amino-thiazoline-4-carboxylic acid hydrolase
LDITPQQIDELRLGALTAIDGLWFLAAEKAYGFDAALELDLEVWSNYGVVILKRMARMLGISLDPDNPMDMATVNFLMETISHIDGTKCEGIVKGDNEIEFHVHRCSWWDNLRSSGREDHIPCEKIDNTIFRHWLEAMDPSIEFEITSSLPRGDDHCAWTIKRKL